MIRHHTQPPVAMVSTGNSHNQDRLSNQRLMTRSWASGVHRLTITKNAITMISSQGAMR